MTQHNLPIYKISVLIDKQEYGTTLSVHVLKSEWVGFNVPPDTI